MYLFIRKSEIKVVIGRVKSEAKVRWINIIGMIYLYVKTHNKTGLKYLGQTTADPYQYQGSGVYWTTHLKKNGDDVTTKVLHECKTYKEIEKWGSHYSKEWDVVKSSEWANVVEETASGICKRKSLTKDRPICKQCEQRHVGINYKRNGKTYYRSRCDSCIRENQGVRPAKPNWTKSGYKKKMVCDKCHFKARWGKQIIVYYVDGDLKNTQLTNLKSICLNCSVAVEKQDMPWIKDLGLTPDN